MITLSIPRLLFRNVKLPKDRLKQFTLYNNTSSTTTTSSKTKTPVKPSWIDFKYMPAKLRPYLHLIRADKQVGTLLLLWPCWWSIALAAPMGQLPDLVILSKFSLGALLMRSAGCIINDMWDRDFDKHVERTKTRPLASGELNLFQASAALFGTLSCSLAILLTLNSNSILLGFASMPLVVLYPLMKRYTYFPQAVLGLAMNWGALLGWAEVCGGSGNSLSSVVMSAALPLYVGGVCWTLVYDTIYGYQDCDDDQRLGLKSTSLYLGETPRLPLTVLGAGMIAGLVWSGHSVGLTYPFYLGMAASSAHLAWQITTLNIQDKHNLWTRFHSNQYLGLLVTMSIVAGHIVIA